ncbi:MAG TPA: signal recognition particle-docking protein FtsY [Armatimonadota bacterium]|nr:signal recognition particle-docking protein FtsY [Armatimonadota bacterium]
MLRGLLRRVGNTLRGRTTIDDEMLEDLETELIQGDVSVPLAVEIVEGLRTQAERRHVRNPEELLGVLREQVRDLLAPFEGTLATGPTPPTVILVLGVNGAGKTTTIAKLGHRYVSQGQSVLMVAGDTFRAAAIEQLEEWGCRVGCEVIAQEMGADPAAVVFDAIQAAKARGVDVVIADTAGRLHTQVNLMEELRKVERVVQRALGRPADEKLLVIDANTGQNAINQARQFNDAIGVTGIVVAKLDSTAKGGTVLSLTRELGIPIKLVGLGEKPGDLADFSAEQFADGIV